MADEIYKPSFWPSYHQYNAVGRSSEETGSLGKDEFLKILIAQIRNQDPLQPMQDRDFIAQMAQFSSVEQLVRLSAEFKKFTNSLGFASALIGKFVAWEEQAAHGGEPVLRSGVVESVTMIGDEAFAVVNGEKIAVSRIVEVRNAPSGQPPDDGGGQPEENGDDPA